MPDLDPETQLRLAAPEPTPERPFYGVQLQDSEGATKRYMIICNEGWRSSIVCEDMYGWAATWLVNILQGRPYAPEGRP